MAALKWVLGNTPTEEGWYRVLYSGDSEYLEGHMIYDYDDYQGWAYWNPAREREEVIVGPPGWGVLRAVSEECDAHWTTEHDEEGEFVIAFCGPLVFPDLPSDLKS